MDEVLAQHRDAQLLRGEDVATGVGDEPPVDDVVAVDVHLPVFHTERDARGCERVALGGEREAERS